MTSTCPCCFAGLGQERQVGYIGFAEPTPIEREYITLVCMLSPQRDRVLRFYIFPAMNQTGQKTRRFLKNDPWLRSGVRLKDLSEFYKVVRTIHKAQSKLVSPVESGN